MAIPREPPSVLKWASEYRIRRLRYPTYRIKPNGAVLVAMSLIGIAACSAMSGVLTLKALANQSDENIPLYTYLKQTADTNRSNKWVEYLLCSIQRSDVSKGQHKMAQVAYKLDVLDSIVISPKP